MANTFRKLFRALAFDNLEIRKLVRGNLLKCLGSSQKPRNYTKYIGYSATITAFGYGVQEVRRRFEAIHPPTDYLKKVVREKGSELSWRSQLKCSFTSLTPSFIQRTPWNKELLDEYVSKMFAHFVPIASCHDEMMYIDCDPNAPKDGKNCPDTPGKDEVKSQTDNDQTKPGEKSQKAKPKPSNKPCKNLGGETMSCSQATDVDLEALSRELGGVKQVEWAAENDLSHCNLIRQASQVTVDSVTRIMTETVSALEDYHAEFRGIIDNMMDALEDSRDACPLEVEVIECKLILLRARADEMKRRIKDLDMLICSLEKLAQGAAEVAFMGHAEYASIAMSERLQSMCLEIKRLREETRERERDMLQLQALIIVETGKSLK